jgi:hypothetical protein
VFTYLAHSSESSDQAISCYNGLQVTVILCLINPRNTAKLKHTRVDSKTSVLSTDRTSGLKGVRPLSVLSTSF